MQVFIYKADIYCAACAGEIAKGLNAQMWPACMKEDSDYLPQGPYANGGGEADTPQHCGACHVFLENPLTCDGVEYVRDARGPVSDTWRDFYGIASQDSPA